MSVVHGTWRLAWITLLVAVGPTVLAGCRGGKHLARESNPGGSINVAIVGTPNTEDLARLTPSLFTATTHIKVNYTILDDNPLREVVSQDVSGKSPQFDVVMIGPYEAPRYGEDGYIDDLSPLARSEKAYDVGDVIPSVRDALSYHGQLYAAPFYAESSFLMYRRDVLRAAGITMPSAHGQCSPLSVVVASTCAEGSTCM